MILDESHCGLVCVVAVSGRVDSTNAGRLTERLKCLLVSGERIVLLDLSSAIYLTSAAIRSLLIVTREAELNDAQFAICGVIGQVREIFEMAEMSSAFAMHYAREDALAKLGRTHVVVREASGAHIA